MVNELENRKAAFYGSGWSFPVVFSAGNYQVNLSAYEANINDAINLVLHTRKGERILEPQFGSALYQYMFAVMDETLKGEMADAVKLALLHNEPRITVLEVDVEYADMENGLVNILITYEYNRANTRHNYVFPFYIREGTNM